jgi:hypothetical protein
MNGIIGLRVEAAKLHFGGLLVDPRNAHAALN